MSTWLQKYLPAAILAVAGGLAGSLYPMIQQHKADHDADVKLETTQDLRIDKNEQDVKGLRERVEKLETWRQHQR